MSEGLRVVAYPFRSRNIASLRCVGRSIADCRPIDYYEEIFQVCFALTPFPQILIRRAGLSARFIHADFGTSDEVIRFIANGSAEVSNSPLAISSERFDQVAFSFPIMYQTFGYAVAEQSKGEGSDFAENTVGSYFFLHILTLPVLGCLLGTLLVFAALHTLVLHRPLPDALFRVFGDILRQCSRRAASDFRVHSALVRRNDVRFQIMIGAWQCFIFLLYNFFSSALQASFIVPRQHAYPFTSFNGAIDFMKKACCLPRHKSTQEGWTAITYPRNLNVFRRYGISQEAIGRFGALRNR